MDLNGYNQQFNSRMPSGYLAQRPMALNGYPAQFGAQLPVSGRQRRYEYDLYNAHTQVGVDDRSLVIQQCRPLIVRATFALDLMLFQLSIQLLILQL